MLTVTDNGVKIALQSHSLANTLLPKILLTAGVLAVIGGLKMLGIIGVMGVMIGVIVTLLAVGIWQFWQSKNRPQSLCGGELSLTKQGFIHQQFGKTTQYQLAPTDTIQTTGTGLAICNQQGKTLYQIQGFSEAKHCQIAQAVMNGKTIQTQAKNIKMQSN
ncbi:MULTISPECIES: hypothetical protein [unclassified Moraxella]|uniref:hypothetical protein n=1 Tax=unclassified Moraxella TaxID=2685852 RepID=UPI003AF61751